MTPISLDLIERKRSLILKELALLSELRRRRVNSQSDAILQHALIHALQLAISAIIDIAQHIASERGQGLTSSYAESIQQLGRLKVLPKKFAFEFSQAAKLRNVLVHAYDNLDIDYLAGLVPQFIKDSKRFLLAVKRIR